jgi:hypothetical protein
MFLVSKDVVWAPNVNWLHFSVLKIKNLFHPNVLCNTNHSCVLKQLKQFMFSANTSFLH